MKMRMVVKCPMLLDNGDIFHSISDIYEIEIEKTKNGKFGSSTQWILEQLMNRVDLFGDTVTFEKVKR
jgi:hypothetical protein